MEMAVSAGLDVNTGLRSLVLALLSSGGFATMAQALPDMTATEVRRWFSRNTALTPLEQTQKYEPGMSDFDSTTRMAGGTVSLTVFLNEKRLVESETIDYRPGCYSNPNCSGTIRFEQADRGGSLNLIKTVWGQTILNDFQTAQLVEMDTAAGTQRWYEGQLYNYETWHYTNGTIAHFSVVSRQSSQAERIRQYKYCSTHDCGP